MGPDRWKIRKKSQTTADLERNEKFENQNAGG
jgi:hypothetical protein